MADILDADLLLVNRPSADKTFKTTFLNLKENLPAGVIVSDNPPADPREGLLWFDTTKGSLFIWYEDPTTSQWVDVYAGAVTGDGTGASVVISENAPDGPLEGDLWYCSLDGRLYIFYQDLNTEQWVDASPSNNDGGSGGASVHVGLNPPTGSSNGDLWWDISGVDGGKLYIYYEDGSSNQWVEASPQKSYGWDQNNSDGNINTDQDVTIPSLNGGPLAGLRNQLINGDFRIWQRGTTVTSQGVGLYTVDRWKETGSNTGATVTRSTTAPAGFAYSAELSATCGSLQQGVELDRENDNGIFEIGSTWTMSVWATQDITAHAPACNFRRAVATGDGTISAGTFTNWQPVPGEPVSNGFTRYFATVTITGDASTGTDIRILNTGLPGANSVGVVNYAGVQLEPGPVATPFEHRPAGLELSLCQRYFFKHDFGSVSRQKAVAYRTKGNSTNFPFLFYFPVEMRTQPSGDSSQLTCKTWDQEGNGIDRTVGMSVATTPNMRYIGSTSLPADDAGQLSVGGTFTMDAEL